VGSASDRGMCRAGYVNPTLIVEIMWLFGLVNVWYLGRMKGLMICHYAMKEWCTEKKMVDYVLIRRNSNVVGMMRTYYGIEPFIY